jgi:hypothetical protein
MAKKPQLSGWDTKEQPRKSPRKAAQAAAPTLDGRSLRAKGRTHQFATRISMETKADLMAMAKAGDCTMTDIVEAAIAEYKTQHLPGR